MKCSHWPIVVVGLALTGLLAPGFSHSSEAAEPSVPNLGNKLELFVDQHMIESLKNARLELHRPEPAEVALKFDSPWDGKHSAYVTVFKDGDKYRMYYRGWPAVDTKEGDGDVVQVACYAESPDGIHWTKPNLGLFEFNGSKDNNIVWQDKDHPAHNFTPFKDTKPSVPKDQLYKAVMDGRASDRKRSLFAYASPDGIHWRKLYDKEIIRDGAFDSQNLVYWDALRGKYVAYFRIWANRNTPDRIRTVGMSTSDDFEHWTAPVPVDVGQPLEDFYTNATEPYFRAPHYAFMFPKRFVPTRQAEGHPKPGLSDGVFLSSRDGLHFDRTFREAVIRAGRDKLNWGDRRPMPAWGLVQTSPDEMSIYYSQHYQFPTAHMVRGVWRLDGIASVQAGYEPGEVVTKPFTFSGKELVLNYATSAAGSVQVEIQDPAGKPIEGYTLADGKVLFGDEIAGTYSWKGGSDVASLAGKPVRLRIVLKDADLYSYRFAE